MGLRQGLLSRDDPAGEQVGNRHPRGRLVAWCVAVRMPAVHANYLRGVGRAHADIALSDAQLQVVLTR